MKDFAILFVIVVASFSLGFFSCGGVNFIKALDPDNREMELMIPETDLPRVDLPEKVHEECIELASSVGVIRTLLGDDDIIAAYSKYLYGQCASVALTTEIEVQKEMISKLTKTVKAEEQ